MRLYASGTPLIVGITSFEISGTEGTPCTFNVISDTDLGTFNNPATSCDVLYTEGKRIDGSFWIGTSSSNKYLTRCDFVDTAEAAKFGKEVGGYTLLWSTSEKTTDDNQWWTNGGYMSLSNGWGRNVVTQETGTFNVNDFRITSTEKSRWSNKVTRQVITENPLDHNDEGIKNIMNFNYIQSNIINSNVFRSDNYGSEIIKGHYMGAEIKVVKNSSGGYSSLYIGPEATLVATYLYPYYHDGYPAHFDLTNYGYYPAGMLPGAADSGSEILDGNWPLWVSGEYEGSPGNEPFGACLPSAQGNSTVNQFWNGAQTGPSKTMRQCVYGNKSWGIDQMSITTGTANGEQGRVMQWWAK